MKVSELYSKAAKYIKAEDLEGREHEVTIDHVEYHNFRGKDDRDEQKTVLFFNGREKGLVLNQVNAVMLEMSWSCSEQDDWVGGTIVLYTAPTTLQGRATVGVRVRAVGPLPPKSVSPMQSSSSEVVDRF